MYDNRLLTFITVAKTGSFSSAAEELFITPTAVKKQMDAFEEFLGMTLFERNRNGVSLTAAGAYILKEGIRVRDEINSIIDNAKFIETGKKTVITMGYTLPTLRKEDIEIRRGFVKEYPQYVFRTVKKEASWEGFNELCNQLGDSVDCIFVVGADEKITKQFNYLQLGCYDLRIAVSVHSKMAEKDLITIDDINGKTILIGTTLKTHRNIIEQLENAGADVRIDGRSWAHAEDPFKEITLVDSEDKVALTYEEELFDYPSLKVIPAEWEMTIPFGIIYHKDPSDKVVEFVKLSETITKEKVPSAKKCMF